MIGYMFVYGVDGFGADVMPAEEEGVYLNFDRAFAHQCKLNAEVDSEIVFYEDGYGEDYYPETDTILAKLDEEDDIDAYNEELEKHIIKDIKGICEDINNNWDMPPFGYYKIVEVEIHE